MKQKYTLPPVIQRGYNIKTKKTGWYIVTPNEKTCLKATRVSAFKDKGHDYVVFRILRKQDRE